MRQSSRTVFRSLPTPLDGFVPRDEVGPVREWLLGHGEWGNQPLLLLFGPGGAGKTRLAIEAVRGLHENARRLYGEHIHFVSFLNASPSLPDFVQTLARAACAPRNIAEAEPHEIAGLFRAWLVQGATRLFVLDNFESVTALSPDVGSPDAGSPDVGKWLLETLQQTGNTVRCLITTQHRFTPRLPHYTVGGLACGTASNLPDFAQTPCCLLYLRRVREMLGRQNYVLPMQNYAPLWELFALVGGMPLAVEMLASRCAGMSPAKLAQAVAQIQKQKSLLAFLRDEEPDPLRTHQRHTGMRACFAWTWAQIPVREQKGFARLGVFSGDFSSHAAQSICGLSDAQQEACKRLSLMETKGNRLILLPMVGEFLREQLTPQPDAPLVFRAFCDYYLALLQKQTPRLLTHEMHEARLLLEAEEINFSGAQQVCQQNLFPDAAEIGLRLAAALRLFRFLQNQRFRAKKELEAALENANKKRVAPDARRAALCELINVYSSLYHFAREMQQRGRELDALCAQIGHFAPEDFRALGRAEKSYPKKVALFEKAVAGYEASGQVVEKVITMTNLCAVLHDDGSDAGAALVLQEALLSEAIQAGWHGAALIASNRAVAAAELGNE